MAGVFGEGQRPITEKFEDAITVMDSHQDFLTGRRYLAADHVTIAGKYTQCFYILVLVSSQHRFYGKFLCPKISSDTSPLVWCMSIISTTVHIRNWWHGEKNVGVDMQKREKVHWNKCVPLINRNWMDNTKYVLCIKPIS